jgi:Mg2+ and Co2+ transporter CorA
MAKNWDDLDTAQKIRELRRDVVRLFRVANDINDRISDFSASLDHVEKIATKAEAVAAAARAERL